MRELRVRIYGNSYRVEEFHEHVYSEWIPCFNSWFKSLANLHVLFADKTCEVNKFEIAEGANSLQLGNQTICNMIMFRGPMRDDISIRMMFP